MADKLPIEAQGSAQGSAQAGAPRSAPGRVGVLIANLGTPAGTDYWSVRAYLDEFLSDRRVIEWSPWIWQPILKLMVLTRRPFSSGRNYRGIWNEALDESPLLTITRAQADGLRARLTARHGANVLVDFCMRYGSPSTESAIRRMQAEGCERILFFPLYPQYAAATTATANDAAFRALMKLRHQPAIRCVPAYCAEPAYIDALAGSVERALAPLPEPPTAVVASYHGLPQSYVQKGDPYQRQCLETSRLLTDRLGAIGATLHTAFQSRFGPEEWLRPYTVEFVAELARQGHRRIAVLAPGFAADCVETLEEINGEIREAFEHAGGQHFHYIPCLNADAAHIDMIQAVVSRETRGWLDPVIPGPDATRAAAGRAARG